MTKNVLIIAGEPSGDARSSELLKELKKLLPDISFWGVGGDLMAREGVDLIAHIRDFCVMGVWEAVKSLGRIRSQLAHITGEIKARKPSFAILVDYPGFNLKIAHFLKSQNIPVVYYVVPQVWAWGEWRVKELKENVGRCLTLFEFEEKFLKERGVEARFVGNPLLDSYPDATIVPHDAFTIALLPGSRKSEVTHMLPMMLGAAKIILKERSDVKFILAESSNVDPSLYESGLALLPSLKITRVKDDTYSALQLSDLVLVASGTATLETAVMEKPMIISYRVPLLTEGLFKLISKLRVIGLANIIAGKEIMPELIQRDATSEKVAGKALEIMGDRTKLEEMRSELIKVKRALGPRGASKRAAEAVSEFAQKKNLI